MAAETSSGPCSLGMCLLALIKNSNVMMDSCVHCPPHALGLQTQLEAVAFDDRGSPEPHSWPTASL